MAGMFIVPSTGLYCIEYTATVTYTSSVTVSIAMVKGTGSIIQSNCISGSISTCRQPNDHISTFGRQFSIQLDAGETIRFAAKASESGALFSLSSVSTIQNGQDENPCFVFTAYRFA